MLRCSGCAVNRTACVALDQLPGALAAVQKHLAQANYFRDPYMIPKYLAGDKFLADVNNERAPETTTASYGWTPLPVDRFYTMQCVNESEMRNAGSNWASLHSLCLVKALGDSVVIPNDSEWFGFFKDGSLDEIWGEID